MVTLFSTITLRTLRHSPSNFVNTVKVMLASIAVLLLSACIGSKAEPLPAMTVWKSPFCGCCTKWVEHLEGHGFTVNVVDEIAMSPMKSSLDIAAEHQSCHTAKIGDYLIEGHVPATDIKKLLTEKPPIRGLAVSGMPAGSPGMEMGQRFDAFDVIAFSEDQPDRVFSHHDKPNWQIQE